MSAKMGGLHYKNSEKHFIHSKFVCIIVYCVIAFGILNVVDSRYLPTRRSEPNTNGLDRLSDLIKNVHAILFQ